MHVKFALHSNSKYLNDGCLVVISFNSLHLPFKSRSDNKDVQFFPHSCRIKSLHFTKTSCVSASYCFPQYLRKRRVLCNSLSSYDQCQLLLIDFIVKGKYSDTHMKTHKSSQNIVISPPNY